MKMVGHSNGKAFFETYVNIDEDMACAIGAAIDSVRAAAAMLPVEPIDNLITEVPQ